MTTAAAPLTITTYDGSGEAVHPSVYDAGSGNTWNGYRYWMAMTPYPDGDASFENPSILASTDGTTWVVPAGLTNPIAGPPVSGYYNDPDLILSGSTMYCVFGQFDTPPDTNTIFESHSTDGVNWSASVELFSVLGTKACVSPSVVWDGTQYRMYFIDDDGASPVLKYKTSSAVDGTWSASVSCTIEHTLETDLWHLDIVKQGSKYYAMICNSTDGAAYFAISDDGDTWQVSVQKTHVGDSTGWDKYIYRGTIVWNGSEFDYWYSAFDTYNHPQVWGIGRTTITGITP